MVDPPPKPGTLFVLLTPSDEEEIQQLRQRQEELQRLVGGEPIEPVHLTCQKFELPDDEMILSFSERLETTLDHVTPFAVTAFSACPMYSEFRGSHILKWEVFAGDMLTLACNCIEATIEAHDGSSYYEPGWTPSLVTALRDIPRGSVKAKLRAVDFPYPLFTANHVVISRFEATSQFETLYEFPFPRQSP